MSDTAARVNVRDPLVGRVLGGKFRIDAEVGRGGMGTVYRATQLALDKTVAVKVMHPALNTDENFASRFLQEARTASRFEHPNSVQVLDYGSDEDGTTYIAMEFLAGRMLSHVVSSEAPLSTERIVAIMSQVLSALAAAHEAGIVHRDLKPENVMLVRKTDDEGAELDIVKVTDFGIAKLIAGDRSGAKSTTTGFVAGTPEYMSPEQARAEPLDGRSDLYACGVMLFELATGQLPFTADGPIGIVLKHVTEPPPLPSRLNPNIDPQLEALILKALEKDRQNRHADARAMRAELRACAPGYVAPVGSMVQRAPQGSVGATPTGSVPAAAVKVAEKLPTTQDQPAVKAAAASAAATASGDGTATESAVVASAPRQSSGVSQPVSRVGRVGVVLGAAVLAAGVVVAQHVIGQRAGGSRTATAPAAVPAATRAVEAVPAATRAVEAPVAVETAPAPATARVVEAPVVGAAEGGGGGGGGGGGRSRAGGAAGRRMRAGRRGRGVRGVVGAVVRGRARPRSRSRRRPRLRRRLRLRLRRILGGRLRQRRRRRRQ